MAKPRRWLGFVLAVGLAVGACGEGAVEDEAGVSRTSVPASGEPAGEEPTTSAPPATAPGTVTTVALPPPVYVDGNPQVTATPTRAPAGTRVELEGTGFTDEHWRQAGASLWLTDIRNEGECVVFAEADHDITVTDDGRLAGSFVVPAKGECRFSTGEIDTGPLRYDIAFRCTACRIGTFTVILPGESMEEPVGTRCAATVVFGVQNFAGDIVAGGLSCDEAEAFLQAHAGPWGPESGPAHADADGFSCDRTGRSDVHLPRANYRCTRGSETIWFIRT